MKKLLQIMAAIIAVIFLTVLFFITLIVIIYPHGIGGIILVIGSISFSYGIWVLGQITAIGFKDWWNS